MDTKISQPLLFHDRHCHKISKFQEHKKFTVQFNFKQLSNRFPCHMPIKIKVICSVKPGI